MTESFLSGVRVVDLSQYLPGPYAAQLLGDLGAAVVKVEPPEGDPLRRLDVADSDGLPAVYKLLNAGKTVVHLDLKTEAGRDAFGRLIAAADILVESYRPGTLGKLGLGRDRLNALNPRLIHVALSGWGQDGPYRLRAGHDMNYMALGGGLDTSGVPEAPVMAYPPVADHAGALQAVLAVTAALFSRTRTGKGAYLDVSLAESVLGWQSVAMTLTARGRTPSRGVGLLNGGAACYQIYRTADDRFVTLSAIESKFWQAFCTTVGHPDWIARQWEPLPQTDLTGALAALFATRTLADWIARLDPVDCCFEPVHHLAELPTHPHIAARGQVRVSGGPEPMIETLIGLRVDGAPPPERAPVRIAEAEAVLAAWSASPSAP